MKPMDALTAEDAEKITGYMETYAGGGGYSMDCAPASLGYLLRYWNIHKEELFQFLGNKLIVEKEIDIEYPGVLMWREIEEQLFHNRMPFVTHYYDMCNKVYNTDYNLYACLSSLLDIETLCHNTYNDENILVPTPEGKPIALNKGSKAMKMLAKIAHAYDIDGFEEFRLRHSMILNHKRFKGTLCISVHPLDYMTMSDNTYNWDSCMSWQKPGEYRQGTIESMNTEHVVVAYLKGKDDMDLWENGPKWNNKRWRQLFYVCPECMTDIRGYPYDDQVLRDEVFTMLRELMETNAPEWAWEAEPRSVKAGGRFNQLWPDTGIKLFIENHIMYNDYTGSHTMYVGPSMYQHSLLHSDFTLVFSGETLCLHCGEDWTSKYDRFNTEYLLCPECTGEYICSSCGECVCENDLVYFEDSDEIICHYCAERVGSRCYSCGEWYHDHNIENVYMKHAGYIEDEYIEMCPHCIETNPMVDDIGPITLESRNSWTIGRRRVVSSENFSGCGFNYFGFYGIGVENMMAEALEYKASQESID